MAFHVFDRNRLSIFLLVSALFGMAVVASPVAHATTIMVVNNDGAGEGLNDPTPVAPVEGTPGTTTIGVYRPSTNTFYLRNSSTYGPPDIIIAGWGAAGDMPVVGDWDGNGTTTIGVYRPSTNTFYLRNSNTYGPPDIIIAGWGAAGDTPVVGDWDGL